MFIRETIRGSRERGGETQREREKERERERERDRKIERLERDKGECHAGSD